MVPTLNDEKTLTFYPGANGLGKTSPIQNGAPLKAECPASGIARYDWNDELKDGIKMGEEFSILAQYLIPVKWGGGGTLLRVESYHPEGQLLCRLEIDIFRDGLFHIVRNAHYNSTGNTADYYDFGKAGPPQITGKKFTMALHGVLDVGSKGIAELYIDGEKVISLNNVRTWFDPTHVVQRARFAMVQAPGAPNPVKCELHAAELVPGLRTQIGGTTVTPTPPAPVEPEKPTTDPCDTIKAQLTKANQQLDQVRAIITSV